VRAAAEAILRPDELEATVASIAAVQARDGHIPWFAGGHGDPWNHVEAAMALSTGGEWDAAEAAYRWLARTQRPDGSWHAYYRGGRVEDPRRDTNACAYVATGAWQHHLVSGSLGFLERSWPMLERAIAFVLAWQRPGGEVVWSVEPDGTPGRFALLAASSSIYLSLRCGVAAAERLGLERPDWEIAAGRLRHAIWRRPSSFEPKDRFAMDWYYPVLTGAVTGPEAAGRIDSRWQELVIEGRGVRCVADGSWVTVAETAECALACLGAGRPETARSLLDWVQDQRLDDGSYHTGLVYPQRSSFPRDERTTYSAAALVLAHDALAGTSPAAGLFLGAGLPAGLDLEAEPSAGLGDDTGSDRPTPQQPGATRLSTRRLPRPSSATSTKAPQPSACT
jgi:hypothetical protein